MNLTSAQNKRITTFEKCYEYPESKISIVKDLGIICITSFLILILFFIVFAISFYFELKNLSAELILEKVIYVIGA